MTLPLVVASDLRRIYRANGTEVHAVRDISLVLEKGEMVAIMGPSGCGKTTLLNCLSGLDRPDAGEIFIEGTALHDMSDRARTRYRARRMGFVFQFYNLLPVLTALENVELPLLVSGVKPGVARQRALEMIARVGVGEHSHHRPAELSGGQSQRFQIARALVNDPAIVWADEPTGNLDSKAAADVVALMQQLNRERGLTFVLVTHDPAIGALCDRVLHMQDGQLSNGVA